MQTTSKNNNLYLETPITLKIKQATKNIPRRVQWRIFIFSLIMLDLIIWGIAFRLAYFIRFQSNISIFKQDVVADFSFYQKLVFIFLLSWIVIFKIMGLYNRQNLLGGTQEYALVFNATAAGMLLIIFAGFLVPDFIIARGWLLFSWFFAFFFVALGRFIFRRVIYALRERGYYLSPAVIVGANEEGISLAEQLSLWKKSGLNVLGFIDNLLPAGNLLTQHHSILGSVTDLSEIVKEYDVEEIILASSSITVRDWRLDIFKSFGVSEDVNVRMSSGLYEIITTGLTVKDFAYVPLVIVNKVRLTGMDRAMKSILDYSLTIPGLILISPLLLLIAILIKLDSPGPVIHRRRVLGVGGRQFDAYKFRSMYVDGEEILKNYPDLQMELNNNHKLKDDPRVTRMGKFMRKWSLDELPQLFNILKGEMSFVGPRMITEPEIEKYSRWDMNLLTIRPGLTGLWQISGRSDISYEQRVRLDMQYIRNWSIWLDLQILTQTIPAVIRRRGAY